MALVFCRLEILTRDAVGVQVIATRYVIGATLIEIQETADCACRRAKAPGYRLYDLHTAHVEEVWEDV